MWRSLDPLDDLLAESPCVSYTDKKQSLAIRKASIGGPRLVRIELYTFVFLGWRPIKILQLSGLQIVFYGFITHISSGAAHAGISHCRLD